MLHLIISTTSWGTLADRAVIAVLGLMAAVASVYSRRTRALILLQSETINTLRASNEDLSIQNADSQRHILALSVELDALKAQLKTLNDVVTSRQEILTLTDVVGSLHRKLDDHDDYAKSVLAQLTHVLKNV